MNIKKDISLTDNEFICILAGSIMGISILKLPATAVISARQDGWIAVIIGAIYPLYIILMASIIIKKFPDTNIMDLTKRFLGNFLGNLLNFLFMAQFLYYIIFVLGHGTSMVQTYAVWFMTPFKILLIFIPLVIYGTRKGLKVLARINVLAFFGISLILISAAVAFKNGSMLNIEPVFGSGLQGIFKGSINSSFAYSNMEILLIIHPFLKKKDRAIKLALITTAIVALYYTWAVFTTTYYMGPDIVVKSLWPFYFVTESVKIPVINNFRLVLILVWPLIIYKTVSTELFMSTFVLKNITGIDDKKWCLYLSPLLFIPVLFENEVQRRYFADIITPYVTLFNLSYVTLIAIFVIVEGLLTSKNKS